jgi:hypothetical protein
MSLFLKLAPSRTVCMSCVVKNCIEPLKKRKSGTAKMGGSNGGIYV